MTHHLAGDASPEPVHLRAGEAAKYHKHEHKYSAIRSNFTEA